MLFKQYTYINTFFNFYFVVISSFFSLSLPVSFHQQKSRKTHSRTQVLIALIHCFAGILLFLNSVSAHTMDEILTTPPPLSISILLKSNMRECLNRLTCKQGEHHIEPFSTVEEGSYKTPPLTSRSQRPTVDHRHGGYYTQKRRDRNTKYTRHQSPSNWRNILPAKL